MKNKVLKAMACFMSVCMLSMSLAGCGDDAGDKSSAPGSDTPKSSDQPQGGADDASQPGDEVVDIGADRSNGLFPAYDFGGIELTVLKSNDINGRDPDDASLDPVLDGDKPDDEAAIAKKAEEREKRQDRKDYIEAKYNVKLTFVEAPTSDWDALPSQMVMEYTSGHPVADIMDVYYQHMMPMIAGNLFYDFSNDMDGRFTSENVFSWAGKTYGIGAYIAGEGLYYNKTMIKEAGMEKTPAEMFAEGHWSNGEFLDYLRELKANLDAQGKEEEQYPLFVDPTYWIIFGPGANGEELFTTNGELHYLTDATMESFETYLATINEHLNPIPAVYDDEGNLKGYDTWNYPNNTFQKGNTIAMAHRAAWQADGVDKSLFELGFVPYPWGNNVSIDESKIGQPDAYLTLDGYIQYCFDGQMLCLTNGIQNKVSEPIQLLSMLVEWMGWDSRMSAYVPENAGEPRVCGWLGEEGEDLDADLYWWSMDRTTLDIHYMLMNSDIDFIPLGGTFYRGESLKGNLESAYNKDMKALIDAGYTTEDAWTADFEPQWDDEEEAE